MLDCYLKETEMPQESLQLNDAFEGFQRTEYDGDFISVADFIREISELNRASIHTLSPSISSMTFYRGQANGKWWLSPRLYREGLFEKETVLISEFTRIAPEAFAGMTRFDALVKMQHYGLPTRLLDMTQNPLVALFFACVGDSEVENDGAVYVFPQLPVFREGASDIKIIMKYAFGYSGLKLDIQRFVEDVLLGGDLNAAHGCRYQTESDVLYPLTKVPFYAVLPSMTNARIVQQAGSFMLFGMSLESIEISDNPGTLGRKYGKLGPVSSHKRARELWKGARVYRIPSQCKADICNDLALLGISKNQLFPELEYKAEYVTQLVRRG
jgi:hypothetical protein